VRTGARAAERHRRRRTRGGRGHRETREEGPPRARPALPRACVRRVRCVRCPLGEQAAVRSARRPQRKLRHAACSVATARGGRRRVKNTDKIGTPASSRGHGLPRPGVPLRNSLRRLPPTGGPAPAVLRRASPHRRPCTEFPLAAIAAQQCCASPRARAPRALRARTAVTSLVPPGASPPCARPVPCVAQACRGDNAVEQALRACPPRADHAARRRSAVDHCVVLTAPRSCDLGRGSRGYAVNARRAVRAVALQRRPYG
jgi:hypothetical protein